MDGRLFKQPMPILNKIKTTIENYQTSSRFSLKSLSNGVPQGSVQGPLLFLIYINSLLNKIPKLTQYLLFADDTTLLVTSRSKEDLQHRAQESVKIT